MAEKKFSLADQLFNPDRVAYLAGLFSAADPGFAADRFQAAILPRLGSLELKERATLIAEALEQVLPPDFPAAAAAIQAMLPPPLDPTLSDDDFGQFIFLPVAEYVERNGCSVTHLALSLDLLHALTQRFSVEFAIRRFLSDFPEQTLERMQVWADDPHYHVRRLVSEGTRPKLPWGRKTGLPVDAGLPLLDRLHADPTRFVTRSVANHLNDISKTHPDLVLNRLKGWHKDKRQKQAELDWMTKHALRGLIKAGHPDAMALLGFDPAAQVDVGAIALDRVSVPIGEGVTFDVTLTARQDCALIVDYVVDKLLANGKTSPKVGKLKQLRLKAGQSATLTKTHVFVKGATTVTYHPGAHELHLQVNGKRRATATLDLHA